MSTFVKDKLPHTANKKSQENGEDNLQSFTWRGISENNIVIFKKVIEEIAKNKDRFPLLLFEAANTVRETSLDINTLPNQKEDFEELLADASGLVGVIWQAYNKENPTYHSIWPPPHLKKVIKELIRTVQRIHGFMKRKCEKNLAKRMLLGYFGLRDRRKFKKYQGKLDFIALGLENKRLKLNIKECLLEVVDSQAQPQSKNSQFSVRHVEVRSAGDIPAETKRTSPKGNPMGTRPEKEMLTHMMSYYHIP